MELKSLLNSSFENRMERWVSIKEGQGIIIIFKLSLEVLVVFSTNIFNFLVNYANI